MLVWTVNKHIKHQITYVQIYTWLTLSPLHTDLHCSSIQNNVWKSPFPLKMYVSVNCQQAQYTSIYIWTDLYMVNSLTPTYWLSSIQNNVLKSLLYLQRFKRVNDRKNKTFTIIITQLLKSILHVNIQKKLLKKVKVVVPWMYNTLINTDLTNT